MYVVVDFVQKRSCCLKSKVARGVASERKAECVSEKRRRGVERNGRKHQFLNNITAVTSTTQLENLWHCFACSDFRADFSRDKSMNYRESTMGAAVAHHFPVICIEIAPTLLQGRPSLPSKSFEKRIGAISSFLAQK
jgi:hypothetical protein